MDTFVIDASVAVKWVVEEDGTTDALELRETAGLIAPKLLVAECANILWKKVERRELLKEEAVLAARLLQSSNIELLAVRSLIEDATRMAIETRHPAYDSMYLTLAVAHDCRFVTADERLVRKLRQGPRRDLGDKVRSLAEAARL